MLELNRLRWKFTGAETFNDITILLRLIFAGHRFDCENTVRGIVICSLLSLLKLWITNCLVRWVAIVNYRRFVDFEILMDYSMLQMIEQML